MGSRADLQSLAVRPRHLLRRPASVPSPLERRRDEALKPEIQRVYDASLDGVYGAKKVWKQLNREGVQRRALHRASD